MIELIHKPSVQRVLDGGTDGDGLLALFEAACADAEIESRDTAQFVVSYFDKGDEFEVGTYVPELWIVVRKVTDEA